MDESPEVVLPDGEAPPEGGVTIAIRWHPELQAVTVHPDPAQVKTWGFAKALLQMGIDVADMQVKMAVAQNIQKQAQRQAHDRALAGKIMRGHG